MIDAGPLTQEDADEYHIQIDDTSIHSASIWAATTGGEYPIPAVRFRMTNSDALELAAQLLIGAVYTASDSDYRERAWKQILDKRINAALDKVMSREEGGHAMTAHIYHPDVYDPKFAPDGPVLKDDCPRCQEHADNPLSSLDQHRIRRLVEMTESHGPWLSDLDRIAASKTEREGV